MTFAGFILHLKAKKERLNKRKGTPWRHSPPPMHRGLPISGRFGCPERCNHFPQVAPIIMHSVTSQPRNCRCASIMVTDLPAPSEYTHLFQLMLLHMNLPRLTKTSSAIAETCQTSSWWLCLHREAGFITLMSVPMHKSPTFSGFTYFVFWFFPPHHCCT